MPAWAGPELRQPPGRRGYPDGLPLLGARPLPPAHQLAGLQGKSLHWSQVATQYFSSQFYFRSTLLLIYVSLPNLYSVHRDTKYKCSVTDRKPDQTNSTMERGGWQLVCHMGPVEAGAVTRLSSARSPSRHQPPGRSPLSCL